MKPVTTLLLSSFFTVSLLTHHISLASHKRPGSTPHTDAASMLAEEVITRVSCGGTSQMLSGGRVFEADTFFTGGKIFTNPSIADIAGTDDDLLYLKERSTSDDAGSFTYNIPVSPGAYTVRLHFAEIYFGATDGGPGGAGNRVFSVAIEQQPALTDYDIYQEAGAMTAVVKTFEAIVTDGTLTLDFTASINQPSVSAIEVLKSSASPPAGCDWTSLAPSPVGRKEGQSAVVNGSMYTFGGYYGNLQVSSRTEVYDPQNNQWIELAPIPRPVTHVGAVVADQSVWLIGGFEGDHPGPVTDAVQVYNTVTDTWDFGPSLPAPCGSGAAALLGRKIHVFGGVLSDRHTDTGNHYVLDLDDVAAGWQAAAPLPEPRNHLGGAATGGKIYAIGGQTGHDGGRSNTPFLHAYDPATNSWTRLADLPGNRSHFEPGTIVLDGKIIIVGGSDDNTDYADVLTYDPASNGWSKQCDLPSTLVAPFAKVIDGNRLIVAQGALDNGAVPEEAAHDSRIARTPGNFVSFSSSQVTLDAVQGQSATAENLLWTLSGEASYTIDPGNTPPWLTLTNAAGTAGPLGAPIEIQANAAGLTPGTYTATLQAATPGYTGNTQFEVILTVTPGADAAVVFAVNAGGAGYTDSDGTFFQSDTGFTGGQVYATSNSIAGTADEVLYQSERYGSFNYRIPVTNGSYEISIKLAEIYFTAADERLFSVAAEGQEVVSNLDIYAQAGNYAALDIVRTVNVTDGELTLEFIAGKENSKLSALLVKALNANTNTLSSTAVVPAPELLLFPNPAAGEVTLQFASGTQQDVQVELTDAYSNRVLYNTVPVTAGERRIPLGIGKLKKGIYVVKLVSKEGVATKRLVVDK